MKKKVVAGLTSAFLMFALGTSVYADYQSGTFTYNGKTVSYSLDVDWNWTGDDYGKARTEWTANNQNKVYAYLVGDDESFTDTGYAWAEANVSETSVWDFNSTHALLHATDGSQLVSRSLSDW